MKIVLLINKSPEGWKYFSNRHGRDPIGPENRSCHVVTDLNNITINWWHIHERDTVRLVKRCCT